MRTHYVCLACDHYQRREPPCQKCGAATMTKDGDGYDARRDAELAALVNFEPNIFFEGMTRGNEDR